MKIVAKSDRFMRSHVPLLLKFPSGFSAQLKSVVRLSLASLPLARFAGATLASLLFRHARHCLESKFCTCSSPCLGCLSPFPIPIAAGKSLTLYQIGQNYLSEHLCLAPCPARHQLSIPFPCFVFFIAHLNTWHTCFVCFPSLKCNS